MTHSSALVISKIYTFREYLSDSDSFAITHDEIHKICLIISSKYVREAINVNSFTLLLIHGQIKPEGVSSKF